MIRLVAQPWWVNLLVLVPCLAYAAWRRGGLTFTAKQLAFSGMFAAAFGFVEAAVVVYLRAAVGLLPGYQGTLADVARLSGQAYQQSQAITQFPPSLLTVEVFREAATIVMLASVALLVTSKFRERWAAFLWTFAIWDIVYYAGLWALVRWPASLKDFDILFLIPVPWVSPVWFPLLVSGLAILTVLLASMRTRENRAASEMERIPKAGFLDSTNTPL